MSSVLHPHVELDERGVPHVAGTRTKVVEIALDRIAHHWDADEIQRQHPHLTLAQIHGALAYYYDHQAELDRAISEGLARVEAIRTTLSDPTVRAKLRAKGLLP